MPIFRVKSVKIYTGQKNLHWRRRPRRRQLSGMYQSIQTRKYSTKAKCRHKNGGENIHEGWDKNNLECQIFRCAVFHNHHHTIGHHGCSPFQVGQGLASNWLKWHFCLLLVSFLWNWAEILVCWIFVKLGICIHIPLENSESCDKNNATLWYFLFKILPTWYPGT